MGCSASNASDDSSAMFRTRSLQELEKDKEMFLQRRKEFDLLRTNNKVFDDELKLFLGYNHERFEDEFPMFWEKHKNLVDPKNFSKETFKEYVLTLSAQPHILSNYHYSEYDISEFIVSMVKELKSDPEYKETDAAIIDDLLKNTAEKFPPKQKGFIYSHEGIGRFPFAYGHVNNNFKFNAEFEVGVLNLILIKEQFENIGYMRGIAEIILMNKNIKTVLIQLLDMFEDSKPFEKSKLKYLNIILDAIITNGGVKALGIMLGKGEKSLDLGNEVFIKLGQLIQKDFLHFIYLYRLSFNDCFGKAIREAIPRSQNLKFFGILSDDVDHAYLNDIYHSISQNNSLVVAVLQKYPLNEQKVNELRGLTGSCKSLKLFKYFKMAQFD